ncbi:MAG TPA: arylsulfotransferase family protein, partial [Solirubrobacteraceae bacterium]|nr:arylsulfotransferase family protein [Solirubrobacteraceae bacterium]
TLGGSPSHGVLAASGLRVIPFPGTPDASPSSSVIFSALSPAEVRSVTVQGTRSGRHGGRLVQLPDGAGTAFVPDRRFAPGEQVRVSASLASPAAGTASGQPGATRLTFSFGVGILRSLGTPAVAHSARGRGPTQHFHSEPGLRPPVVRVTSNPDRSSGDIMVTPEHSPQTGPMILNARGQVLWFDPVNAVGDLDAFNLEVQRYEGRPVLTWWRGSLPGQSAEDVIMGASYRTVATVRAANGYSTDEHEFQLTPSGAAYITTFAPVQANLTSVGGPANGTVMDNAIQEIDIRTGQLLWQWNAYGHVPLTDSYARPKGSSWYEFFHMNSIQQLPDGNLLVSARNTWAVYEIDRATGRIIWTVGGKHSSFHVRRSAQFAWQHDAHLSHGRLSLFDDAWGGSSGRQQASQSSAKILQINQHTRTVSLIKRYRHAPPLLTGLEGSVQRLPNHDVFVGWGGAPDFTEYAPGGRQLFNGSFALGVDSYRAYRFPWRGHPLTAPSLAVTPEPGGNIRLWASWNGATDVAAWRVLGGGRSSHRLSRLGRTGWAGFETAIRLSSQPRDLTVQALNAHGRVLRSSRAHAVPPHVDVFADRAFVSASTGWGSVPVGCFTGHTCHLRVKVVSGKSVLAHTARVKVFSGRGALVAFRLSSHGLAALNSAHDHRVAVEVTVRDSSGALARWHLALVPFSTNGQGPPRTLQESSALHILGGNQFVSRSGVGGILAACYSPSPCRVRATVSARGTPIASSQPQLLGVNELAYVQFQLTAAGKARLASAPGNQLAAHVRLTSGGHSAAGQVALVGYQ